ncbi:MAG: hypothetical protein ACR2M0_02065 [Chloroflexia bacterium]
MPNPASAAPPTPLTRDSLGHLAYLYRVLTGHPINVADDDPPFRNPHWEGFYAPQSDVMNFGLRFQLAFASYAVAALGLHTPAYTRPYVAALGAAVERMLDVRAWGYWRQPAASEGGAEPAGHVAVLMGGHRRPSGPMPPPADPVAQDNVQFSGHLGTMLGLYERAGGDYRYDRGFVLADPESGVSYPYTHGEVARRIVEQMRANYFHGVACEPACAYVPCNNHAMSSNAIHDATHGTDYSAANAGWLRWVRGKMLLHGPAARGLFGACYLRGLHLTAPVAFQFTDSWGLAFLLPFDRALVRRLYPRYRKRLSREGGRLYVGSAPLCEKMEISDTALNTAFGLIVARGVGDRATADRLAAYAAANFGPVWSGPELSYAGAPRTLHTTALYAIAALVDADAALLLRLFHAPRDPALASQPCLDSVSSPDPAAAAHLGISEAVYDPAARSLIIATQPLGEPPPDAPVLLSCARVPAVRRVTYDGQAWDRVRYDAESRRLEIVATAGAGQRFVVEVGA